jgi:hypothetical protein
VKGFSLSSVRLGKMQTGRGACRLRKRGWVCLWVFGINREDVGVRQKRFQCLLLCGYPDGKRNQKSKGNIENVINEFSNLSFASLPNLTLQTLLWGV